PLPPPFPYTTLFRSPFARAPVNAEHVPQPHLLGRQKVRQRIYNVPLNRPLQMPRAILQVSPFSQQILPRFRRHPEQKLPPRRLQHPLLHYPQLNLQNLLQLLRPQGMKHHHLVQPVHEFRRKLPLGCFRRVRSTLLSSLSSPLSAGCTNPRPPVISSVISPPPRFEVRKIIVADRSTRRLSPSVSVALSKIPSSNCHSASEAFSISSNRRKISLSISV